LTLTDINEKSLVTKTNSLVSSLFALSVQEQRIVLLLISMIDPRKDENFAIYDIPVDIFTKIIGATGNAYHKELDALTDKLMRRFFRIDDPDGGWLKLNWLSSCHYHRGQGFISLQISPLLKPYLLNLQSHFTTYRLKNVLPLRSAYSIRIYELLKQHEAIGQRYFSLMEIRKILDVKDNEYVLYSNFKLRVIAPSIKEISKKTDILVTIKEKKQGRKVVGICFFIRENRQQNDKTVDMVLSDDVAMSEDAALASLDVGVYQRLLKNGLSAGQAKVYMAQHGAARIAQNLDYVDAQARRIKIDNMAAYTAKAIKNDWQIQTVLQFDTEPAKDTVKLVDGMGIVIDGEKYTLDCGVINLANGVVTLGQIKQMIKSGEAKIV